MRRALENLFAFLLRDTTKHAELLSLRLQLLEIGQPMENFLLRLIPDRTCVVENQIGLLNSFHLPIAFLNERSHDLFRVMDVHLTPEGFEVEGLPRALFVNPRHMDQYNSLNHRHLPDSGLEAADGDVQQVVGKLGRGAIARHFRKVSSGLPVYSRSECTSGAVALPRPAFAC